MSLLANVSRPGPSTSLSRLLVPTNSVEGRRFAAGKPGAVGKAGYIQKKDGGLKGPLRKKFPMYKALPEAQRDIPLFKSTKPAFVPPTFTPAVLNDPTAVGKPFIIDPKDNNPMRAFGIPRKLWLEFKLLSRPFTVVREITKDALNMLKTARETPSSESRVVFTGRPGCGKSFLLLQAVEYCTQKNWVVIYIPRAVDLVNSTTSYIYDIRTQTYLQPWYSFQTLQRMLNVNKDAFAKIKLQEEIVLEKSVVPKGTSLVQVIEAALAERTRSVGQAPIYLEAVMKTLEAQTQFPVLLAIDDMQTIYGKTAYRDPHYVPIHSYHLSLPRLLLEFASGKRSFKKGAVVGAITASRTTHPVSLELRDALDFYPEDFRVVSPLEKRNKVFLEYAEGLKKLEVPEKLTLAEAVGVFEIWKEQQVFGKDKFFYDESFMGKYTESGGNARDFVWKGLLATLDT